MPPTGAQMVAGGEGVLAESPETKSKKQRTPTRCHNAGLFAPVGGGSVWVINHRGFAEYHSPPATLCCPVGTNGFSVKQHFQQYNYQFHH